MLRMRCLFLRKASMYLWNPVDAVPLGEKTVFRRKVAYIEHDQLSWQGRRLIARRLSAILFAIVIFSGGLASTAVAASGQSSPAAHRLTIPTSLTPKPFNPQSNTPAGQSL